MRHHSPPATSRPEKTPCCRTDLAADAAARPAGHQLGEKDDHVDRDQHRGNRREVDQLRGYDLVGVDHLRALRGAFRAAHAHG
jgi:hypothetical protein